MKKLFKGDKGFSIKYTLHSEMEAGIVVLNFETLILRLVNRITFSGMWFGYYE